MLPLYSTLHRSSDESQEQKRKVVHQIIPAFYKRLRQYREISLEELAERSKLSISVLESFEQGEGSVLPEIDLAYCRFCFGNQEITHFQTLIFDFMNPGAKLGKEQIALDALKRFGLMMPNVDYQNLHTPKGVVLEFRK
jgi:transcriptional regulator with XRE-family HTH domain